MLNIEPTTQARVYKADLIRIQKLKLYLQESLKFRVAQQDVIRSLLTKAEDNLKKGKQWTKYTQ